MSSRNQTKNITKLSESLHKETHFTKREVESLLMMYQKQTTAGKPMDRSTFRDLLHNMFDMTDDMLMDRVFRAFDKDNDSYINMEEWVIGLSVYLRGDRLEKCQYCFEVFDLNSDGYVSREEMFHLLKFSLVKQPTEEDPDEGVKDLVEITLKKMDYDHDSRLSYADFVQAIEDEPLLLEAFGKCLPAEKKKIAFETLIGNEQSSKYR